MTKSRGILPAKVFWTVDQVEQLTSLYPDTRTDTLADQMGMSVKRLYAKAKKLGLKKSEAYLASPDACRLRRDDNPGIATRFQPGGVSWNKGLHYVAGGRSAETRFKPGHRGGKALEVYQPIGTERISKDGYRQVKINDDFPLQSRWRGVHIVAWEEVNGPLPKGYAIVFRDGNKLNVAIENLECISRADLMRRNTYHRYPKEIAALVQLRGALNRRINRIERQKNEQ